MSLVELRWGSVSNPPPSSGVIGKRVPLLIIGHGEDVCGERNQIEFGHVTLFFNAMARETKPTPRFQCVAFIPNMQRQLFETLYEAENDLIKRAVDFLKILAVKCVFPANQSNLVNYTGMPSQMSVSLHHRNGE
jgi:hypothetical protein